MTSEEKVSSLCTILTSHIAGTENQKSSHPTVNFLKLFLFHSELSHANTEEAKKKKNLICLASVSNRMFYLDTNLTKPRRTLVGNDAPGSTGHFSCYSWAVYPSRSDISLIFFFIKLYNHVQRKSHPHLLVYTIVTTGNLSLSGGLKKKNFTWKPILLFSVVERRKFKHQTC